METVGRYVDGGVRGGLHSPPDSDHKGPPRHSSPLSPLREGGTGPFGNRISPGRMESHLDFISTFLRTTQRYDVYSYLVAVGDYRVLP